MIRMNSCGECLNWPDSSRKSPHLDKLLDLILIARHRTLAAGLHAENLAGV